MLSKPVLLLLHALALNAIVAHAIVSAPTSCGGTVMDTTMKQFTGPMMDPASIPKWQQKLPNPLHPDFIFKPDRKTFGPHVDFYRIAVRQFKQQILPPGCPTTTVWGYGLADDPMDTSPSFSSPGRTIVAFEHRITKVQWSNQLPTTHLFPVDPTFHCGSAVKCQPAVRVVSHLHGGHIEADADGFPDAWVAANYSAVGREWKGNASGYIATYSNDQEGTTLWYHDHAQGITRLNVYAGMAGFYILRGHREMLLERENLLPRYPFQTAIVIQDRAFKPDGSLYYPDYPFGGTGGRIFNTNFGNVFMVNGIVWPKMLVEHRRYRLRILNGCNSRFLKLQFMSNNVSNPTELEVMQIGAEQGLLNSPVNMTGQGIILAPAERADIIVDFTFAKPGEEFILTNTGATPYPYGASPTPSDDMGQVILFKVKIEYDANLPVALPPPAALRHKSLSIPLDLSSFKTRKLVLFDVVDPNLIRIRRELGTNELGAMSFADYYNITETPALGATEVWEIYNPTGETHPIHVHLVHFLVIDRHNIEFAANGSHFLGSTSLPVLDNERGPKDTVRVDPGTVVRIISTFDKPGLYGKRSSGREFFIRV